MDVRIKTNKIIQGDALKCLKELPDKCINMVLTSPPYWALRDYGKGNEEIWDAPDDYECSHLFEEEFCSICGAWKGQLGLEPTFDLYIKHLCDIFEETKRVLRDDGTCWVNIGDSYVSSGNLEGREDKKEYNSLENSKKRGVRRAIMEGDYPSKCLGMIPFRFAIEMVNRGWILRNTIIWHKRNCMPCSVKDRFTVDFEYLFFFSKKQKYYFETQREPHSDESMKDLLNRGKNKRMDVNYLMQSGNRIGVGFGDGSHSKNYGKGMDADKQGRDRGEFYHPDGRNKRTVWTINPKPFSEAHFAVFPEELCETPIRAGCPEFVCVKCGKPRIKKEKTIYLEERENQRNKKPREEQQMVMQEVPEKGWKTKKEFEGWDECDCNAGFTGGTVLDCFFGAGTTGLVALKQWKKFIGIELNKSYINIAMKRLTPYLQQTKLGDFINEPL